MASPLLPTPIRLALTPAEAAARCTHLPGLVFFDAAVVPPPLFPEHSPRATYSIIAAEPVAQYQGTTEADWSALSQELARRQATTPPLPGPPPGMAAGWVEYDGAFSFSIYERLLAYEHPSTPGAPGQWYSVGELERDLAPAPPPGTPIKLAPFENTLSPQDYIHRIREIQEAIARGDLYQVNLTHQFRAPLLEPGDAAGRFALYQSLREASPAPYALYMERDGRTILSASPELFLAIRGDEICTRPIKGTRPRLADPEADRQSAADLIASTKENAELIMITDLERNDLGQICRYGTVHTREKLALEAYEQVFHLVSTVEGRLRPDVDPVAALRACFPGGSITGAPKRSARQLIAQLEPTPRHLYTGTIGYFGFHGESCFNIAIRTLLLEHNTAHFHVGAGIVADSVPEHEWSETLHKAAGILRATQAFIHPL